MKLDACPKCGNQSLGDRWSNQGRRLLEQHCVAELDDESACEGWTDNGCGIVQVCGWTGPARTPEVQKIVKSSSHLYHRAGTYSIYDRFGHVLCRSQGFDSKAKAMPFIQKELQRGVSNSDAGPYTALWWRSAGACDRAEVVSLEGA